jgi:two-component system response regulator HydG
MSGKKVLIIDDDPAVLRSCEMVLGKGGYELKTAIRGDVALQLLSEEEFDVVLTDLRLPDTSGMEILKEVKARSPDTEVIVMTAFGTIEKAVEAVKLGAYDFITKPFETVERLILSVNKAIERRSLITRTRTLEQTLGERYRFGNIIGKSPKMQEIFKLAEIVAKSDSSILIQGESGTGKEVLAKAIHFNSLRKANTFVTINCAALTETLIESELFGHEKGAFTGAIGKKLGLFETANGGTAFLDEIGEVPTSVQVKLLRVLQNGEIKRVGGNELIKVNVRIIAATNRDLKQSIKEGRFRDDLYYRLNVISITLPPLRERTEDIPLLANYFLKLYTDRSKKTISGYTPAALKLILSYHWPGNVRELENAVERAVILCQGHEIDREHLLLEGSDEKPSDLPQDTLLPYKEAKQRAINEFHRSYLKSLLIKNKGNVSQSAQEIQMDVSNFRKLLKKSGVNPEDFKIN